MRILMTADSVGGVWTFSRHLIEKLLERKHTVALLAVGPHLTSAQNIWCSQITEDYPDTFQFESAQTTLEWMPDNQQAYLGAQDFLLFLASEVQAEVLLSSQFCFGALPLPIPKVIVAHSDVLSWASACRTEPLAPSAWLDTYLDLVTKGLDSATAVVAPTHWMLSELSHHFRLPQQQRVIYNGLNLFVSPAETRKLQAVTAGRLWDEGKGLDILDGLSLPLPLMLAGDRGEHLLPPSGQPLGRLSEFQMLKLLSESSIYLCTSKYEPFGLAPLEAALCGCAVVARDIPSLREVWADGALYFSDQQTLSSLLQNLVNQPELLLHSRRCSFERAQFYTATRMADQYLELLSELLARPSGAYAA